MPNAFDKRVITASFALPSVGGAVTRSRSMPFSSPSTWLREDCGWICTSRVQLFRGLEFIVKHFKEVAKESSGILGLKSPVL